jgi:hypothetical protein
MVVLSATATLLPAAARAETPMGVASLAEAKAIYEQDLAACKRDAVQYQRSRTADTAKPAASAH